MSLKAPQDRVVISIDLEGKNSHTFSDGTKIRLERQYNNLNRRETEPVNAIVVDAENIPIGAEVLVHHNATHDVNRIFNHSSLSGTETASDIKYFSISVNECFLWRMGSDKWHPMPGYATALRVFQPHTGLIQGIPPTKINNTLYILDGEYKGLVCLTLKASDYEIIYQENTGREGRVIRCRVEPNELEQRESEIIAIDHDMTDKVNNGELLIGLNPSNAYKLVTEAAI